MTIVERDDSPGISSPFYPTLSGEQIVASGVAMSHDADLLYSLRKYV